MISKHEARKIAEDITSEQLNSMFERAKVSITNWRVKSKVNPHFSIGATWNIFYRAFGASEKLHVIAKANMIREFGEHLDESLKPAKKPRKKQAIIVRHEEPNFKRGVE